MRSRKVKRKIRIVFSVFIALFILLFIIVVLVFGYQTVLPILKRASGVSKDKIIKPLGSQSNISELNSKLSSKNLILEYLKESTISGEIVGQVKSGPLVYFSKNRDAEWQVQSLILLISQKTADNKKPVLIDLRYTQPIVKF